MYMKSATRYAAERMAEVLMEHIELEDNFKKAQQEKDKASMVEIAARMKVLFNKAKQFYPKDDPEMKEIEQLIALSDIFTPKLTGEEYQKHVNKQKKKVKK